MTEEAIRIRGVSKQYRTGQLGGHTLKAELSGWWARKHGREEELTRIGETRRVGQRFYALSDINLTVHRGEALGIVGRNGAGKSTLLKLISRITAPTTGTIDINGRVASMLEVGTGFHGDMTGRENVYLNGSILGMSRAEIRGKMDQIAEFSEIGEFLDTPVKRYSSGMYVKLAFSVAAHLDSEIMIMDEVLAVGDMEFQKKCLNRMRAAAQREGRTILYVSHNMNTIRHLCSRCVVLDKGRLTYDGDVDRAIALYLGLEESRQTLFRFDETFRPYDSVLRMNKRFELLSLQVENPDGPYFRPFERQTLTVCCRAMKDLPRLGLRLELTYQDGVKVGTMLPAGAVDLTKGEHTLRLTMDTSHLMSGQYTADLVAFQYDEDGNEDILDGVYPGAVFQVEGSLEETGHVDWHHQYWGHIRLHDLEVRHT